MCKEQTLTRSSRSQMFFKRPTTLLTVQNCIKSFWTVTFSTYGNVCLEFFGTVTSETISPDFVNMNVIFLLAVCVNSFVDTGGLQRPQIFAKIDLLPIENNSEKKKVAKKI